MWGERQWYARKMDLAKKYPHEYLSTVVDGAGQQKFSFPSFITSTKCQRGNGIGVLIITVLNHMC